MNFIETSGIIFKVVKYSETSIICDIYTRERGLMSCIVSGVRSGKTGQKAAIYKTINIVQLIAYDHSQDKLNRIKEISLSHHYQRINMDVLHSSVAIFILEVCRNAIKEKEANYPLYEFIESFFKQLDEAATLNPNLHLLFLAQLSSFLGFAPMNNHSENTPCFNLQEGIYENPDDSLPNILDREMSNLFNDICQGAQGRPKHIQTTRHQRNELTEIWLRYFKYHIPGFREINSYDILKIIL